MVSQRRITRGKRERRRRRRKGWKKKQGRRRKGGRRSKEERKRRRNEYPSIHKSSYLRHIALDGCKVNLVVSCAQKFQLQKKRGLNMIKFQFNQTTTNNNKQQTTTTTTTTTNNNKQQQTTTTTTTASHAPWRRACA